MPLGTLDRSAPTLFKHGPSPLSRLALYSALALFLMVADARFRITEPLRKVVATALYPLQWLMLQYAALRQSLFLIWQDSPEAFFYEKVREALVIINRMTGYDEEDIYEYLENSFESLLWDWGYFALLAGF